jgi:hypothetical protein
MAITKPKEKTRPVMNLILQAHNIGCKKELNLTNHQQLHEIQHWLYSVHKIYVWSVPFKGEKKHKSETFQSCVRDLKVVDNKAEVGERFQNPIEALVCGLQHGLNLIEEC